MQKTFHPMKRKLDRLNELVAVHERLVTAQATQLEKLIALFHLVNEVTEQLDRTQFLEALAEDEHSGTCCCTLCLVGNAPLAGEAGK